ncbi:hypothetical protein D8674_037145 [Pyrus ussuriensis x Pyrus communis]|uniref:Uncharacterized protein n=1 Tax=Pyrus ussuriensis x Pyrus communis TaxID=2448454 RepID=A0A5N5FNX5_9ROSA|nr:hypothetical protein D8674_037145 [Pyrus ussuriensis x Pyrus communis]
MNSVTARSTWNVLKWASEGVDLMALTVMNGNLEWVLAVIQRKMTSSGIEWMIKREKTHHLKNSEKRILAHLACKLKVVLLKKISWIRDLGFRGFRVYTSMR